MTFTWEATDIRGGRRVGNPQRKEQYLIGYVCAYVNGERWVLISLTDGMVLTQPLSCAAMAAQLNKTNEWPLEFLPGS